MEIRNQTITASESPITYRPSGSCKYFAVRNDGDSDILVSSANPTPTAGADDVMTISAGTSAVVTSKDDVLYISSESDGTCTISAQDDKVFPWGGFNGGGKGGEKDVSTVPIYTAADNTLVYTNVIIDTNDIIIE